MGKVVVYKVVWTPNTAKFGSGFIGRIGKIKVGEVFYAVVARGEPAMYEASLTLPGIQMKGTTRFSTAEAAMARVDTAVKSWFMFLEAE